MTSLASIPALRGLAAPALTELTRASRPVRLRPGTVIRGAGQAARGAVLLLSGTVAATYAARSGAQVWPAHWTGPAIADKPAALRPESPATGLVTRTAVVASLLPRAAFLRLLHEHQSVRTHVLLRLAYDVTQAQQRLADAATLAAIDRVAAWLEAHSAGGPTGWSGSQEDLARLLGLSRVTVSRALNRLASAGVVRLSPGRVTIIDHAGLRGSYP